MKKTNGFSLMETMIVLLIVSVIAAASAPMINKKMITAASDKSPWVWVGNNKSIAYNLMNANQTASIGAITPGTGARLHISTDNDKPQISLGYRDSNVWRLLAKGSSLNLSTLENTPDSSIAIGYNSRVGTENGDELDNATALGANSQAQKSNATALGANSQAQNSNATALGAESQAQGSNSIAIGYNAKVPTFTWKGQTFDRKSATAIGALASASGNYGIALGGGDSTTSTQTEAKGDSSIAIGRGADSTAPSTIAIGRASVAKASKAIAIGSKTDDNPNSSTTAEGDSSIAIGSRAYAVNGYSIAIGGGSGGTADTQTKAARDSSIAIGRGAETNAINSIAIGRASEAYSDNQPETDTGEMASSIAIGGKARATKLPSIAIGSRATASGQFSTAIGPGDNKISDSFTEASADNSIAIGRGAEATAENSIAIGRGASAIGESSIAIGTKATFSINKINVTQNAPKAKHKCSVAIGAGAETKNEREIVLGDKYTTVYIPGNLVVDRKTILGNSLEKNLSYTVMAVSYDTDDNPGHDEDTLNLRYIKRGGNGTDDGRIKYGNTQDQYSDRRLKDVGKAFKGGLEEIKKLEVFNYTFKKDKSKTPRVGVMAQDLEKIFPNAVFKGEDGFLRIRMEDMFYAMVNAIKELDSKISILEQKQKKIDELESKVTKLEKRLADLEKKIK
ncbi:tail fiber domain-containing protein [bacterium]|nr:tail fiber domain-containing protein [bacterium]